MRRFDSYQRLWDGIRARITCLSLGLHMALGLLHERVCKKRGSGDERI
jgi:hypothetical protein